GGRYKNNGGKKESVEHPADDARRGDAQRNCGNAHPEGRVVVTAPESVARIQLDDVYAKSRTLPGSERARGVDERKREGHDAPTGEDLEVERVMTRDV